MADEKQPAFAIWRGPCVGLLALVLLAAGGAGHGADAAGKVRLAQRAEPRISVSSAIVAQPARRRLSIQIGRPRRCPQLLAQQPAARISLAEGTPSAQDLSHPLFCRPRASIPASVQAARRS
jgi:hypothetical protein